MLPIRVSVCLSVCPLPEEGEENTRKLNLWYEGVTVRPMKVWKVRVVVI